jgi:hypothetical protein
MPMDRKRYPKDWEEISRRIRFERANGFCEWCGIRNGWFRSKDDHTTWYGPDIVDDPWFKRLTLTKVVLTVAHLGVDKPDGTPVSKADTMDCRPENLAALCQRCHLNFDRDDHLRNRLINRRRRLVEAGQQEMF